MKIIDAALRAELLARAAESPRRRTHYNLHETLEDPIQRLCVAVLPETRFQPHRQRGKWELVTVLQGEMTLYTYDDKGTVLSATRLGADGVTTVELPPDCWHNMVVHTPGIFLEVKAGPYTPTAPEDFAPFDGVQAAD